MSDLQTRILGIMASASHLMTGYAIATTLDTGKRWWQITGHGSLYKALDGLVDAGFIQKIRCPECDSIGYRVTPL